MRRRRHHEEDHNKERWLVSYADFITLLFAFFVVMYSISSVNEGKYKVLSQSLEGVFNAPQRSLKPISVGEKESKPPSSATPEFQPFDTPSENPPAETNLKINPEAARKAAAKQALNEMSEQFSTQLADLIGDGLVTVNQTESWIELSLRDSILFSSGDAIPNDQAFPLLEEIARIIRQYPNAVLVEGFTDNIPITTAAFPSNWELSTARASAVVRILINSGLDPSRLAAIGYGENQPVARNDTPEGRQRNRRVVLLIEKDDKVRMTLRRN